MPELTEVRQVNVKAEAWRILYSIFGERLQQDELDLMDSVLRAVTADMQDEIQRFKEDKILRRFPHLDKR